MVQLQGTHASVTAFADTNGFVGESEKAVEAVVGWERRERAAEQARRAEWLEVDQQLAEQEPLVRSLTHAALLLAGFHPHRREWRLRREHPVAAQNGQRDCG